MMFPMLLSRQQLGLACHVYCQEHGLFPHPQILNRVAAMTIKAGLVILVD